MGFRFRRTFPVFTGVRANVGRKSASISLGVRGLHYTIGTAGRRFTAGLPGTGLFWTTKLPRSQTPSAKNKAVKVCLWLVGVLLAVLAGAALLATH